MIFVDDVVGEKVEKAVAELKEGEVMLLENTRFYKEEEADDKEFCKKLAKLADVFVNDAFGTAHRAHASTTGVAEFVKESVSGFLIKKELDVMGKALTNPDRPFVAVLGGAKVGDKIGVIRNLLEKADVVIVGGGMAYTFQKPRDTKSVLRCAKTVASSWRRNSCNKPKKRTYNYYCRSITSWRQNSATTQFEKWLTAIKFLPT